MSVYLPEINPLNMKEVEKELLCKINNISPYYIMYHSYEKIFSAMKLLCISKKPEKVYYRICCKNKLIMHLINYLSLF